MITFNLLLILSWIFAYISERSYNISIEASYYFTGLVILILSLLSGLRTSYNDTTRYIYNFVHNIPSNSSDFFQTLDISLGENPVFYFYQFIIKSFISDNPQVFILLSSFITITLMVLFYKKYSIAFSQTIFLYITSGLFILSMAAIKQMLSIAIGIWAIHFFIENKHKTFLFLLLLASTIHPFILLYLVVYFLTLQVWTKKIILVLFTTLLIGVFFTQFVETILGAAGTIGVNYDSSYILNKAGVNPLRLAIFAVTPILSYIYREEINNSKDKMLIVAVNFSIISLLFMIVASYGGANMFGRLANYFEPFTYLGLSWILYTVIPKNYNILLIIIFILAYSFFFYYQFFIVKDFNYSHILIDMI